MEAWSEDHRPADSADDARPRGCGLRRPSGLQRVEMRYSMTMRAVVIHKAGGRDVLVYEETERPEPGDGEVLIRVRAASVNPVDYKQRRSLSEEELPKVLGRDVSG